MTELKEVCTGPFASSQSQMKSGLTAVDSEFRRMSVSGRRAGQAGAAPPEKHEAQPSRLLAEAQERGQQGRLGLLQDVQET